VSWRGNHVPASDAIQPSRYAEALQRTDRLNFEEIATRPNPSDGYEIRYNTMKVPDGVLPHPAQRADQVPGQEHLPPPSLGHWPTLASTCWKRPSTEGRTLWLAKYLRIEDHMQKAAHVKPHCTMWFDCLANCGLREGHASWGQFCIDNMLGHPLAGDVRKGLDFKPTRRF
jgi:hypothetical protein